MIGVIPVRVESADWSAIVVTKTREGGVNISSVGVAHVHTCICNVRKYVGS